MSEQTIDPVHGVRYEFEETGDELLTVDSWMEDGGGLPKHYHPIQEETWWVVDGEVRFHLDGSWRTLRPEDGKVVVSPGIVHGLANRSGGETHLRCEVRPPMDLREFLTESAWAAREGLFMKGGIPKSWRGAKWAATFLAKHEQQTVMTFPPRFAQRMMKPLARLGG
jgi:quercetin dioxygenase-like cupin family protein